MQYTLRNVPLLLDEALRAKAREEERGFVPCSRDEHFKHLPQLNIV